MWPRLAVVCASAAMVWGSLSAQSAAPAAPDLEQHLRSNYLGKTFSLRGFYSGNKLRYDVNGAAERAISGDWTADGFVRVEDLRLSHERLLLRATRLIAVVPDRRQGFVLLPAAKPEGRKKKSSYDPHLEIELPLGPDTGSEQVDAALSRLFFTSNDSLPELVPEYWRPCVRDGLADKNKNCRFSPEISAIPGVATRPLAPGDPVSEPPENTPSLEPAPKPYRVGKGVSPPKLITNHEPEFSEAARAAKYQGRLTLGLVINQEGVPTRIHIVDPLGCGLDQKAVETVSDWRFLPARKEGEPVSVEIAVEIDFHLY